MTLRHENIVNHMAFWDEKHKSFLGEETRFYLVMEYCRGGSLEDYIVKRRRAQQAFEHELIESWACQICECMLYMHSQSIIHRDIKPENILLTADYLHIKVRININPFHSLRSLLPSCLTTHTHTHTHVCHRFAISASQRNLTRC